jgi:hypothetical protein
VPPISASAVSAVGFAKEHGRLPFEHDWIEITLGWGFVLEIAFVVDAAYQNDAVLLAHGLAHTSWYAADRETRSRTNRHARSGPPTSS